MNLAHSDGELDSDQKSLMPAAWFISLADLMFIPPSIFGLHTLLYLSGCSLEPQKKLENMKSKLLSTEDVTLNDMIQKLAMF